MLKASIFENINFVSIIILLGLYIYIGFFSPWLKDSSELFTS